VGTKNKRAIWLCRCDCGRKTKVTSHELNTGDTKSCGCLNLEGMRARAQQHRARLDRFGTEVSSTELAKLAGCGQKAILYRLNKGVAAEQIIVQSREARLRRSPASTWLVKLAALGASGRLRPRAADAGLLEGFRRLFKTHGVRLITSPAPGHVKAWQGFARELLVRPRRRRASRSRRASPLR